MADAITTRAEARTQGRKRYFTGKACKRGHVAERYVSNLECVVCKYDKDKARAWHKHNKDKRGIQNRKWKRANAEKVRESYARYYAKPETRKQRESYYQRNKERFREKRRVYYAATREQAIEYTRQWSIDNPDWRRKYYSATKERRRLVAKEWRKNNPEKYYNQPSRLTKDAHRRALEAGAAGTHTSSDLKTILAAQRHRCANCNADLRKVKKHLDHIIPLKRGGTNDKTNLQYLCAPCNLAKAAKDPIAFAREQGRLL
jgi:5-methylcytosine-specific restriction endonuclease McrA